jgi:hypothetical protein
MTKANDTDRYVVPNKDRGGWDVVKEGHKRASRHEPTQEKAVASAKKIVRNLGGGEVRVQRKNRTFGDPTTVKGPKQKESRAPDRRGGSRKKR